MIVADASVVTDYLLGGSSPAGDALAAVLADHEPVCAPHLLDVEVAQVLRRYALRGDLGQDLATRLVHELTELPITRYEHRALLARAFALRTNVTMYDAVYLALAEALGAPLLTADAALGEVPGSTAVVDVRLTA